VLLGAELAPGGEGTRSISYFDRARHRLLADPRGHLVVEIFPELAAW
jgi:hypothetical protein